ncbi:hypothetical protein HanOQP8_Chr17g0654001 [Helianthus annuus]|nr:hypothetical protein HanHA89_Chr17g0699631 [Helianthus annuus]KAJ0631820.1 hypothetical protein HanLR1_Chr17g0658231 [Helianthus annuus]KAJ0635722.1 hypothetical protein HanOQP8_Chr17g0654001 [Helianthus annuus]
MFFGCTNGPVTGCSKTFYLCYMIWRRKKSVSYLSELRFLLLLFLLTGNRGKETFFAAAMDIESLIGSYQLSMEEDSWKWMRDQTSIFAT